MRRQLASGRIYASSFSGRCSISTLANKVKFELKKPGNFFASNAFCTLIFADEEFIGMKKSAF